MESNLNNLRVMLVTMNGDGPTTGFAVRVIMICKTLEKAGASVILLRLYPGFKSQGSWRTQFNDTNIELIEFPVFPTARFSFLRQLSFLITRPIVASLVKFKKVNVIQAEAHEAGLAVLRHKSAAAVIVDFHGAAPEEALQRKNQKVDWLEHAEKVCVEKADAALVVSPKMIDHLRHKHPTHQLPAFFLVPVNVEELFFDQHNKAASRKNLKLDHEHVVYVYSGGAQSYQCIDEMASLFQILRTRNANARLLIISGQKKEFQRTLQEKCPEYFDEIIFKSAQKHEVPALLAAADIAFLLRHDDTLNTVSCPTKFGEYLACGLPVITTPWAGHAPQIVDKYKVGVIVDFDLDDAAKIIENFSERLSSELSHQCKDLARKTMHWEISTRNLFDCYQWLQNLSSVNAHSQPTHETSK